LGSLVSSHFIQQANDREVFVGENEKKLFHVPFFFFIIYKIIIRIEEKKESKEESGADNFGS
jgi:hypothetical protein